MSFQSPPQVRKQKDTRGAFLQRRRKRTSFQELHKKTQKKVLTTFDMGNVKNNIVTEDTIKLTEEKVEKKSYIFAVKSDRKSLFKFKEGYWAYLSGYNKRYKYVTFFFVKDNPESDVVHDYTGRQVTKFSKYRVERYVNLMVFGGARPLKENEMEIGGNHTVVDIAFLFEDGIDWDKVNEFIKKYSHYKNKNPDELEDSTNYLIELYDILKIKWEYRLNHLYFFNNK